MTWQTPLRGNFPTLAQYLGSHGYATAGFVANTNYCSSDTGLDRGFTHYEDYVLDLGHLRPLRTALLVDRAWAGVASFGLSLTRNLDAGPFRPWLEAVVRWLLATGRKDAGSINREFLAWLSHRPEPQRPFFAFLNYFDAHSPYLPPEGTEFRIGQAPQVQQMRRGQTGQGVRLVQPILRAAQRSATETTRCSTGSTKCIPKKRRD